MIRGSFAVDRTVCLGEGCRITMTRAATLRFLCRTVAACAFVCLVSCTTFDKAAEKPLVQYDSPAEPVALRQAVIEVFGDRIEGVEEEVVADPDHETLQAIYAVETNTSLSASGELWLDDVVAWVVPEDE